MDFPSSFVDKEPNVMSQTLTEIDNSDFNYILEDYGQYADPSFQQQLLKSFDFEEYLGETLSKSAKICEEILEAEKANETEVFYKEAFDNLLNMECSPSSSHHINGEDAEQQRKEIEKFLEDSYNNLLHMFDGVSQTAKKV